MSALDRPDRRRAETLHQLLHHVGVLDGVGILGNLIGGVDILDVVGHALMGDQVGHPSRHRSR
eukprot:6252773-Pyramimonas_sp.AAC.1